VSFLDTFIIYILISTAYFLAVNNKISIS